MDLIRTLYYHLEEIGIADTEEVGIQVTYVAVD